MHATMPVDHPVAELRALCNTHRSHFTCEAYFNLHQIESATKCTECFFRVLLGGTLQSAQSAMEYFPEITDIAHPYEMLYKLLQELPEPVGLTAHGYVEHMVMWYSKYIVTTNMQRTLIGKCIVECFRACNMFFARRLQVDSTPQEDLPTPANDLSWNSGINSIICWMLPLLENNHNAALLHDFSLHRQLSETLGNRKLQQQIFRALPKAEFSQDMPGSHGYYLFLVAEWYVLYLHGELFARLRAEIHPYIQMYLHVGVHPEGTRDQRS